MPSANRLAVLAAGIAAACVTLVANPPMGSRPLVSRAALAGFVAGYVGSERCGACHQKIYDTFRSTGHPVKIRTSSEARAAGLPKPDYVSWEDILYVVGGFRWKARYIGQDGFFITGSPDGKVVGRNQFNLETGQWTDWNAGRKVPYDCGECHTTGYSRLGNQLRRPGLVGTWAFNGIQCEACHGPGLVHAATPARGNIRTNRTAEFCGTCHRRGSDMSVIPAAGGFIEHREQYQELLASPHRTLTCVSCHDPHRRARELRATCETCHSTQAADFRGSRHQRAALSCTACHMPDIVRNAAVTRSTYEADAPTHLARITRDPDARMFTDDGRFVRTGALTLAYACLRCHADRSQAWAAAVSAGIHRLGK
jgi:hypothetical protein